MWAYIFWTACMVRGEVFLSRWWGFSLTEFTDLTEPFWCMRLFIGSFFSHRAHRVHGGFWRTFRAHRRPSAYRVHRALLPKMAVRFCEIGWLNVSVGLCVFCSSVFFCERKKGSLWEKERSSVRDRILTMQTGNVKIFYRLFFSTFEKRPNKKQEHALLRLRTWFSWPKKGMFNEQEGHVLKCCS